jgi:hypothetical protein
MTLVSSTLTIEVLADPDALADRVAAWRLKL